MRGAEGVARRRAQRRERLAEQAYLAPRRLDDAADQVEQRALAAAARAMHEQAFAGGEDEFGQLEDEGVAVLPAEDDVAQFDRGRGGGRGHQRKVGVLRPSVAPCWPRGPAKTALILCRRL